MKGKKLQQLLKLINPQKDLGPYGGGNYVSPHGKTLTLSVVPLSGLNKGLNTEKVILGRVVCSITSGSAVSL